MTNGVNLRIALAGAAAALVLAAPAAAAPPTRDVVVCNEAGMAFYDHGGTLSVVGNDDPNPPARHKDNLSALPGHGVGLLHAAEMSPALALCAPASDQGGSEDNAGDNGAGDTTGGGIVTGGDNGGGA